MSYSEERSPKRQRRSYSPASPSTRFESDQARVSQSHTLPQTPPPSVHMSPSWHAQSLPPNVPATSTFPTPPSTAGFHSQHITDRSMDGSDNGQESGHPTRMAGVEHHRDDNGDGYLGNIDRSSAVRMSATSDYSRSNRDRSHGSGSYDVHGLFRVTTEPIAPSRPHASQNVLALYSLEAIQASVARRDAQGNKINKLRKSYENKVKALGLEGRSKAEVGSLALQGLLDPGWDADIGNGQTTWQARSSELLLNQENADALMRKLDSALALKPGHLPKAEHESWKNILGLDDGVVARPAALPGASRSPAFHNPLLAKGVPAAIGRSSTPNSPRPGHRPERANKKRRYDESSYAGYQEGYDDDGYSTGGVDERSRRGSLVKRQKRKDFGGSSSPPSTFAAGMVGVHTS